MSIQIWAKNIWFNKAIFDSDFIEIKELLALICLRKENKFLKEHRV